MIVCHCMNVTDRDIHAAMDWMRRSDPDTIITPGKVYRALGKKADCGGCLPLFMQAMTNNDSLAVPSELRHLGKTGQRRRQKHEG